MKGVVLAGGKGTRLRPTTEVMNKHVLPIYDRPMIFYPVEALLRAGIDEIMIISTPEDIGRYIRLLEEEFEADFSYRVQKEPAGIAHALALAEEFVNETVAVFLGDNIVLEDLSEPFQSFETAPHDAQIFLSQVTEPSRYGIAELDRAEGEIQGLVEKPDSPSSDHAIIGLYLYTKAVFDKIRQIEPSDRGEYEITDVNKLFLKEEELTYDVIEEPWFDVGTPEGMYDATKYVRETRMDEMNDAS